MRVLEQLLSRVRARARATTGWIAGVQPRPARVTLRLNDDGGPPGLPASDGKPLERVAWEKRLISVVEWLGPCEVRFLGGEPLDFQGHAELVRFAHRLECTTSLVTTGKALDLGKAQELIDRGLAHLVVWIGSLDPDENLALTGGKLTDALDGLEAALRARKERGVRMRVSAWVPQNSVPSDLATRLEELGVTEVQAVGPWLGGGGEPSGERQGPCPVASRRVELLADGTMVSCPFKSPIGAADALDLAEVWRTGEDHFASIGACGAGCDHPELIARH